MINSHHMTLFSAQQFNFTVCDNRKEGNALFNDACNTFYFTAIWHLTYGKGPLRQQERGNLLLPHGLLFPINSKGSFICTIPHTTAFVTPVMEHWLEREIAQWVHPM